VEAFGAASAGRSSNMFFKVDDEAYKCNVSDKDRLKTRKLGMHHIACRLFYNNRLV
jgi:hypothetical protein